MFGFEAKDPQVEEKKSNDVLVLEKLEQICKLIDTGAGKNAIVTAISECDKMISQLSYVQQSKVSMYWTGGVMGMVNMLKMQPDQIFMNTLGPIKTHVINTLAALS